MGEQSRERKWLKMEGRVWNKFCGNPRDRGRERACKSDRRRYEIVEGGREKVRD